MKRKLLQKIVLSAAAFFCFSIGFSQQKTKVKDDNMNMKTKGDGMNINMSSSKPLDTLVIERVMGTKGKFNNGEYKITTPQNDLSI